MTTARGVPSPGREIVEQVGDEDDEHDQHGAGDEPGDEPVDEAVLAAWRSLLSEHRALLWQLVLHDQGIPHPRAGRAPSSRGVADPGERARDRLRLGLLSELVARAETPECAAARRTLGAHLRHLPPGPRATEVDRHLAECARCRTAVTVLGDIDGAVRSRVAPALLPGAFSGVVATADAAAEDVVGPDDPAGADPATGPEDVAGAEHAGPGSPPARVLPVPGRAFAWLTAAAALALAAVLLLPESVPSGTVTSEGPSPRPSSSPAVSADTAPSAPRPVIGVAVAEPLSARREPGALAAGGSRPGAPAGVRVAFAPRRVASGAVTGPASPRTGGAAVTVPGPASGPATSPPTSAPIPSTSHGPTTPPDPTTAPSPTRPTAARPDSAVTTLVFMPSDRGSYVATLVASPGWLVTSVVDEHGQRAVEHVVSPAAVVADRLHAGRVVVEVTKVTGSARAGSLVVSFVNGSGSALAGSGTYALR